MIYALCAVGGALGVLAYQWVALRLANRGASSTERAMRREQYLASINRRPAEEPAGTEVHAGAVRLALTGTDSPLSATLAGIAQSLRGRRAEWEWTPLEEKDWRSAPLPDLPAWWATPEHADYFRTMADVAVPPDDQRRPLRSADERHALLRQLPPGRHRLPENHEEESP